MNKNTSMASSDPVLAPLQDTPTLIRRIGEVTKLTRGELVDRLRAESRQLGLKVREACESRGLTRYRW